MNIEYTINERKYNWRFETMIGAIIIAIALLLAVGLYMGSISFDGAIGLLLTVIAWIIGLVALCFGIFMLWIIKISRD